MPKKVRKKLAKITYNCNVKKLKIPKRVTRSRNSKDRQYNDQQKKDKQSCTKHNAEN